MKTALTKIEEILEKNIKYINKDDDQSDRYYQAGMMFALTLVREEKETEKQQIIDAVKFGQNNHSISISHEEKMVADYYTSTFETNKETLK